MIDYLGTHQHLLKIIGKLNRILGFLFGYEGEFRCEFVPATEAPIELEQIRHERRI